MEEVERCKYVLTLHCLLEIHSRSAKLKDGTVYKLFKYVTCAPWVLPFLLAVLQKIKRKRKRKRGIELEKNREHQTYYTKYEALI